MSTITRRSLVTTLAGGAAPYLRGAPGRPNLVVICSDQHSGRVLGLNGYPQVRTPNLDRLARMGVNFRNAYSCAPVCVPGRAALMTGLFASDVGSYCNSTPFDGRVPAWPNRLRDAGYYCWGTGKLDLEKGQDYGLKEVSTTHGHSGDPDITSLFRRPMCYRLGERNNITGRVREKPHNDLAVTERGIAWLRQEMPRQTQPWALYLGLTQPHPAYVALPKHLALYPERDIALPHVPAGHLEEMPLPFQVMRNFKMMATPIPEARIRKARAAYYAMLSELDEYVGKVLDALAEMRQLENTVVVYTSDHGEMLGEHGLWMKNVLLENAARVPLLMAGAGQPRGQTVETPVSHVDMVATLLELGGVALPANLRGRSLLPMARGERGSHPGWAFSESHSEGNATGSFMIRKGDWKYIYFSWYGAALYNLQADPGELNNLAGKKEYAAVEGELHAILTSLLDPDAVTEQAFQEQERRLNGIIQTRSREEFFGMMKGRLGPMQARALANKHYPRSG